MNKVPSLITLCIGAIKDAILDEENGNLHHVYVLPPELFNQIIPNLPSLALQNLQDAKSIVSSNEDSSSDDCLRPSKRQKRFENFDSAWEELYKSRWKEAQHDNSTTDWRLIYWEKHLQNCLDAIAETVSITLFDGFLGEVEIPNALLQCISYEGHLSRSNSCSKLTYHCERFGIYARSLRLQSVHCVAEISNILRTSRLEHLEVNWLKSKEQADGLCKLLDRNKETLASVDLVNCKLPATLVSEICDSLHIKGYETNVMKSFSIKRSSFLDSSSFPLPLGLESLLIAASSNLTSLILSDNHIWWKTAKLIFDTLLEAESGLQVLDLSENNISGWLSHFKWRSPNCINPGLQTNKCLNSLRVLNLRANGLQKHDVDCLKYAMVYMPNLKVLNLSENILENDGIMMLVPYLIDKSKSNTPLTELYLENCEISRANQLLPALASFTVPLKFLSLGENPLFCRENDEYGMHLGRFLCSGIQGVNVRATRLGSNGFAAAEREITRTMSCLVSIDISRNDGRLRTASFLSKLISMAPKLTSLKASNNWIPVESVPTICSCLKTANGKLEHLDLRQNPMCKKPGIASILAEFQVDGKPNILLSSPTFTPYDQDP